MKTTPNKDGAHILKGHINLSTVYLYLKYTQYPPGLSDCDKRAVRKRARSFCISKNELYFVETKKKSNSDKDDKQAPSVTLRKVITSEEEQRKIVLEAHIDYAGNHFGIEKTTIAVTARYYWVGISNVVRDTIHGCAVCQVNRSSILIPLSPSLSRLFGVKSEITDNMDNDADTSVMSTPSIFASELDPASYFWEKVEVQILGPYQCNRKRYYVAVALDIFSMWPEATVMPDKTSSSLTHFVVNLVCRYGLMKSLILRENETVKFEQIHLRSDLLKRAGIDLGLENFTVEVTKKTWADVELSLQLFTETYPESWTQCLEVCLLPHRVSRPQMADYTPAYLAHGREYNLPSQLSHEDSSSYIDVHLNDSQKLATVTHMMSVYDGYKDTLKTVHSNFRTSTEGGSRFVTCVEPGQPVPHVKVASVTMSADDASSYKESEGKGFPKNALVKMVSVAPTRPLERGQRRLVVVTIAERNKPGNVNVDIEESVENAEVMETNQSIKMEVDIDDGARPTHDLDPDYRNSTPVTRSGRGRVVLSDRVTRSGRRGTTPPAATSVHTDGTADTEDTTPRRGRKTGSRDVRKTVSRNVVDTDSGEIEKSGSSGMKETSPVDVVETESIDMGETASGDVGDTDSDDVGEAEFEEVEETGSAEVDTETRDVDEAGSEVGTGARDGTFGMHGLGFGMEDLDTYYVALERYKVHSRYPEGFTNHQKRMMRQICQSYLLEDGILFYVQGTRRKVVPRTANQRLALIRHAHIDNKKNHLCRTKMIKRLDALNVYWKGLTLDSEAWVQACTLCLHGKTRPRHHTLTKKGAVSDEEDPDAEVQEPNAEKDDGMEENYTELLQYLRTQKYPSTCDKFNKSNLRRKSKNFTLVDGKLHYIVKKSKNKTRTVLITEKERRNAIKEAHADSHHGQNRTYMTLKAKYYWKGIYEDVCDFIKKCCAASSRGKDAEEESATRRELMSKRVKWFQERQLCQEGQTEMSGEDIVQSLLKKDQLETEELQDDTVRDLVRGLQDGTSVPSPATVQGQGQTPTGSPGGTSTEEAAATPVLVIAMETDSQEQQPRLAQERTLPQPGVFEQQAFTQVEDSGPSPDAQGQGSFDNTKISSISTSDISSVSQTQTGDVVVTHSEEIIQPGLASPSTSAMMTAGNMLLTTGHKIVSSSGNVEMLVVPAVHWNTPDLNMLHDRVRMSFPQEAMSVDQTTESHQSAILSGVEKETMSAGNALAELVKATVGDLSLVDDTLKKQVSDTDSAVASIPPGDQVTSQDNDDMVQDMVQEIVQDIEQHPQDYMPGQAGQPADGQLGGPSAYELIRLSKVARYHCDICGKNIKGTVNYKIHMYKHTGEKQFKCEVCSKMFTNNKSLRIHLRKHTGDLHFLCSLCGKGFTRSPSLKYHMKAHAAGGGIPVSCDVCGRQFTTTSRLRKHKNCKHPVEAPVFRCEVCDKVFTVQRSLKRHMVSHNNIRQYQCQYCGRGFFRKEYLNSHLSQHAESFETDTDNSRKVVKPRPKKTRLTVDVAEESGVEVQQSVVQVAGEQQAVVQEGGDPNTFMFPQGTVQYEVECLTSESTLTEADLKAIHFLAQASIQGQF